MTVPSIRATRIARLQASSAAPHWLPVQHIIHDCGHVEPHEISGDLAARRAYIERLGGRPCQRCRLEQSGGQARASNHQSGLPALKGTARQVQWAELLRRRAMESPLNSATRLRPPSAEAYGEISRLSKLPEKEVADRIWWAVWMGHQAELKLRTEADAVWWIEKRGVLHMYVLDRFQRVMLRGFPKCYAPAEKLWRSSTSPADV